MSMVGWGGGGGVVVVEGGNVCGEGGPGGWGWVKKCRWGWESVCKVAFVGAPCLLVPTLSLCCCIFFTFSVTVFHLCEKHFSLSLSLSLSL